MINVDVTTNAQELAGAMGRIMDDQLPFATSVALNRTAYEVRDAQRARLEERFTIRRRWVSWGIAVPERASKDRLSATIHVDPSRQFLIRHEEGGTFRPARSSRFSIPADAATTGTGLVRRSERPRAQGFRKVSEGPGVEVFQGQRRTFMIRRADGTGGVFRRRGRGRASEVRTLFRLRPRIDLEGQLGFHDTAERVYGEVFEKKFDEAWDRALRTAR